MRYSPWGAVQTQRTIADGIVQVSTASHGGIHLSPSRVAKVKEKFPNFVPFSGKFEWYEEDCDVAIVVATFPEYFAESVAMANKLIATDPYYGQC